MGNGGACGSIRVARMGRVEAVGYYVGAVHAGDRKTNAHSHPPLAKRT